MPPDPAIRLAEAARRRHELTRAKAIRALRELDQAGADVTFEGTARAAGISRSWLYTQPDLRSEIERLREATTRRDPGAAIPATQRSSEASLLRRLKASLDRNQQLAEENQRLRRQLAHALGDRRAAKQTKPVTRRRSDSESVTIGPC